MAEAFSDNSVLTCLFTQMENVSVVDGKLKVLGKLGFWPVVEESVEADFPIEVDLESGMFRCTIDGPLQKDSHPLKYRVVVGDDDDLDEDELQP